MEILKPNSGNQELEHKRTRKTSRHHQRSQRSKLENENPNSTSGHLRLKIPLRASHNQHIMKPYQFSKIHQNRCTNSAHDTRTQMMPWKSQCAVLLQTYNKNTISSYPESDRSGWPETAGSDGGPKQYRFQLNSLFKRSIFGRRQARDRFGPILGPPGTGPPDDPIQRPTRPSR